jgi:hypothetical protein
VLLGTVAGCYVGLGGALLLTGEREGKVWGLTCCCTLPSMLGKE